MQDDRTGTGGASPNTDALDMDSLLQQMSDLADQAGDWRDHLPFAAAEGYLEDPKYRQLYGHHVDGCRYCQQLIGALYPSEDSMAKLLSNAAEMSLDSEKQVDVADAVAEARYNLDPLFDVLLAQSPRDYPGTLRALANVQQWLVCASQSSQDLDSSTISPWTGTVALSLDTESYPASAQMGTDYFENIVEESVSLLLASRFRVAHAGNLQPPD